MLVRSVVRLWLVCALCAVAALAWAATAHAQQPSRELLDLQETTTALWKSGDYRQALPLAEKALALTLREFGADHEQTSIQYYTLGLIAEAAGDLPLAARYFNETVRARERVYGPDSAAVSTALDALAAVYIRMRRPDDAEAAVRRSLKIRQNVGQWLDANHSFFASSHALLGDVALARGDWTNALTSYRQAVRIMSGQDTSQVIIKSIVEEEIKRYRDTFVGLCRAAWATRGDNAQALFAETFAAGQLAWSTSAASALAKMSARLGSSDTPLGQRIRRVQDLSDRILKLHADDQKLLTDWSAVQRNNPAYAKASEEFRAASIARNKGLAPTVARQSELVQKMTALLERCPPGQSKAGCETADRDRLAIGKELGELSKVTSVGADAMMAIHRRMEEAEKSIPGFAEFTQRRTALRADIERAEKDLPLARAEIVRSFPSYIALSEPKPLAPAEVQALLKPDEALVAVLVGSEKSFVWALSHERAAWAEIDAGAAAIGAHVTALRNALDPLAQIDAEGAPGSQPGIARSFDLARAHALYKLVLAPVADVLAGKRHLIVVPTGPLTSLPLQVLITAPPDTTGSPADALRNAAWLIKTTALSVLPSVQSLSALRALPAAGGAARPFFGMGDPVLRGPDPAGRQRSARRSATPARYFRNGLADVRAVSELTPLPETAQELQSIGKVLGATPDAILLRESATETRVKAAPLDQYRVIQFATHGLVAGDLSGLAEPALVLTPPATPTEANDGLLTASEIAALKLNADWVVLSACNTAAGEGEGADALSGLARAFFYAGARSLLVSHWAVYSEAAATLTTKTFATLAEKPNLGRAEAFRQSMLGLIADGKPPSYWAPFVIVGEAGIVRR